MSGAAAAHAGSSASAGDVLELPFDQYQRYGFLVAIRDILTRLPPARPAGARRRALDVGGAPRLIERFLPDWWTASVDPGVPTGPGARFVVGDGSALPFPDGAFELVVSMDTLEHVPAGRRALFAAELHRVSRGLVVLAAPFAHVEVLACERTLYHFVREFLGGEQVQLREHAELGLPGLDDYRALHEDAGLPYAVVPIGLLADWMLMMTVKHYLLAIPGAEALHRQVDRWYNTRVGAPDPARPSYRHAIVSGRPEHRPLVEMVTARFAWARERADPVVAATLQQFLARMMADRARGEIDAESAARAFAAFVAPGSELERARALARAAASVPLGRPPATSAAAPPSVAAACPSAAADAADELARRNRRIAALELELRSARREVARLEDLVRAFENGHFMRAMRSLAEWRRRVGV